MCDNYSSVGSEMKYYIKKHCGKERKLLRCKRKGCQTTLALFNNSNILLIRYLYLEKNNSFWSFIDKNNRNNSGLSIDAQLVWSIIGVKL
jgi:hypothetical protein